jgi:hypothetical protein
MQASIFPRQTSTYFIYHQKGIPMNSTNDFVMDDFASGSYYLIKHLTLFTGLTDRTIRNYLSMGLLQGEKINGLWHFTPEQVEAFISHPAVRPSIQAKHHGLVYDFLLEQKRRPQKFA